MKTRTAEDRRAWTKGRLETMLCTWDAHPDDWICGTLRACLGALDQEREEARQRVIDAAEALLEANWSEIGHEGLMGDLLRAVDAVEERPRIAQELRDLGEEGGEPDGGAE
jgi:hypothetical protein